MTPSKFDMPAKIPPYMRRLEIMYRSVENKIFHEIICNSAIFVREQVSYDNWDGGVYGHAIIMFTNEETLAKIGDFENQKIICNKIKEDIVECARYLPGEFVETVLIELLDDNDPECKLAVNPFGQPIINPDSLNIWKPGYIRLFISHRDEFKKQSSELAFELESYGISSFVAHDTIEPMEEWQHTIRKAMQSMEVMLLFITDNFFESVWTNQEVGVALGSSIPIISLKLQKTDPRGFISGIQALSGNIDNPKEVAKGIYKVLAEKLNQESRLRKATVQAFINSRDFNEARDRFERLKSLNTLTESDVQQIIEGYAKNNQLYNAIYLNNEHNRLPAFLENRTGKKYTIENKAIKLVKEEVFSDAIPF